MSQAHIHARSGRRACLACGAAWGAVGPCTGRESETNAVAYRMDRERPVDPCRATMDNVNEAAGRPDSWG